MRRPWMLQNPGLSKNGELSMLDCPALRPVVDLEITVSAPIVVGQTSEGLRRVIPISGGRADGPGLSGRVLAAGADYQLIRPDGYTILDARYVIETTDGALVYIVNAGVRYGPPEIMARITAGEPVDPALVYFRTAPRFETAAAKYLPLTRPLFLATGVRHPDRVELSVFEVA
jgi:Protein of unknown function (DUF3237)